MALKGTSRTLLTTAAGIILMLALFFAFANRTDLPASKDPAAPIPPQAQLTPTRLREPAVPSTIDGVIDLLDQIDLKQDALTDGWGFHQRVLYTANMNFSRVQIPCIPSEEYDLKIVATRKQGQQSLNIGFVSSGQQGMLILDANRGIQGSLIFLEGDGTIPNPSFVQGQALPRGESHTTVISVRKEGIQVTLDGKAFMELKGAPLDLGLPLGYRVPNLQTLILGSYGTVFRIDEMVLKPVSGKPTLLRSATVAQR